MDHVTLVPLIPKGSKSPFHISQSKPFPGCEAPAWWLPFSLLPPHRLLPLSIPVPSPGAQLHPISGEEFSLCSRYLFAAETSNYYFCLLAPPYAQHLTCASTVLFHPHVTVCSPMLDKTVWCTFESLYLERCLAKGRNSLNVCSS